LRHSRRSGASPAAATPLRTWIHIVKAADWSKPNEVKEIFDTADLLANGRAVFDIGGNKYRLVVAIHYRGKRIYIRFIGTHKEYDKIDANRV
jgi:mRNA interferase HigB